MNSIMTDMQDCFCFSRWWGNFRRTSRKQESQVIVLFSKAC